MKKTHSVSFRIVLLMIAGLFAFSGVLFFVFSSEMKKGLKEYLEEELYVSANSVAEEVAGMKDNVSQTVDWIQDELLEDLKKQEADETYEINYNRYCRNAVNIFKLETIAIYDMDKKLLSDKSFGVTPTDELLELTLQGKDTYDIISVNRQLYAVAAVPFYVENTREMKGAIIGKQRISTKNFVRTLGDNLGVEITIFDGYKHLFTTFDGLQNTETEDTSIIDEVMETKEEYILETVIEGTKYLCDYFPIKDSNGKVAAVFFVGKEASIADDLVLQILKPIIPISLSSIVFFLGLLILIISRILIKKLSDVGKSIKNLSSGEADLTMRIPVFGIDEFADIGNSINDFMGLLQSMVAQLKKTQSDLELIGESLGTNSQESASATNEIMANIDSVRSQSKNQMGAVTDTTVVLEESGHNVEELAALVNEQVVGIIESSAAIEQMLGNIASVSASVRKMADSFTSLNLKVNDSNSKLEHVSEKVAQMSEQSEMLIQANDMIAQVAEQTNLLAMNAAIEAAHAGEAGKGFSVVADEIRSLAESSSAQSQNIGEELRVITESIQQVVKLTKDSQEAFGLIVSQLSSTDQLMRQIDGAMEEQNSASHQILEALGEMKDKSNEVNDKSQELRTSVNNVQNNMNSVSQISETILGSMDEMAAGSQQISSAAQSVSDLANQTRENIQTMDSLLKQFKA